MKKCIYAEKVHGLEEENKMGSKAALNGTEDKMQKEVAHYANLICGSATNRMQAGLCLLWLDNEKRRLVTAKRMRMVMMGVMK